MSLNLNKNTFLPLLNTKFKITFDEQNEYEVKLIEVKEGAPIDLSILNPSPLIFQGSRSEKIFRHEPILYTPNNRNNVPFLIPGCRTKKVYTMMYPWVVYILNK